MWTDRNTKPVVLKDLEPGMTIVNLDSQFTVEVTGLPMPCRMRGYVKVPTTGVSLNQHGSATVRVPI